MQPKLTRPAGHDDSVFVVSVSGGKDSTATVLALREAEIPARYVFADTGWEVPQTYDYLAELERLLSIKIDRVGKPGGMVAAAAARFPSRVQRWCTKELKIQPLRAYHDALEGDDHEPYVCPGCYAVDGPCAPGCIDAEIEREREDDHLRCIDEGVCPFCGSLDDSGEGCWWCNGEP